MDKTERARISCGTSGNPVYETVVRLITGQKVANKASILLDVGCGVGNLYAFVKDQVDVYEGVDVVQYETYPEGIPFHQLDLDSGRALLHDNYADFVVAVETIEHLENPRAFVRELVRLCRPGGTVIVTTPNQLSLLSLGTLLIKKRFSQFTDSSYPAHITALLEIDLIRIAKECGLIEVTTTFTQDGRMPLTAGRWPKFLSRRFQRLFSDTIALIGKKSKEVS